jgi:hypothetical protein
LTDDEVRKVDMDVDLVPGTVDAAMRISAVPWPWTASEDDDAPPPLKETPPLSTSKE